MATSFPAGTELYNALKAEGFDLPEASSNVRLEMPIDGVFQLHYTILLTGDDLRKLGRALARIGERHEGDRAVAVGWRRQKE